MGCGAWFLDSWSQRWCLGARWLLLLLLLLLLLRLVVLWMVWVWMVWRCTLLLCLLLWRGKLTAAARAACRRCCY